MEEKREGKIEMMIERGKVVSDRELEEVMYAE